MTEQVEQVALSASTMTLKTKEEAQLEASVLPWTASNREVTWTSSNSAVVAVDETGGVTACLQASAPSLLPQPWTPAFPLPAR